MMMAHDVTEQARTALADIAIEFARRGWFPATSGNLSVRVSAPDKPLLLMVSASGRDKALMTTADFLLVDDSLRPVEPGALRPSAETAVHARIYEATGCGCVLHVHTVWNNLIAELFASRGEVMLQDLEMLKGLDIWDEAAAIRVPIVENLSHLPALADAVVARITDPRVPGTLIRRHGLYAWGATPFEAKRHVEAFEFMFEYLMRWRSVEAGLGPAKNNDREGRRYEPTEAGEYCGRLNMATLRLRSDNRQIDAPAEIARVLVGEGIIYRNWDVSRLQTGLRDNYTLTDADKAEILAAFREEVDALKAEGGYAAADVVVLSEQTPDLETLLGKFSREHHHSEDEVRFVVDGHGIFTIRGRSGRYIELTVGPGDLITVPAGTRHWFTLAEDRRIKCIRLFQDPAGWAAIYEEPPAHDPSLCT